MIIIISLGDEFTEPRDAPDSRIIKTFSIKMEDVGMSKPKKHLNKVWKLK